MKKSNKLLLTGFLTVLLFLTAVHLTLYAKYKAGNYTVYKEEEDASLLSLTSFPNILFVSVNNVSSATVKFAAVAQMEKDADEDLQFVRKGDTLVISAKGGLDGEQNEHHVLYVPYNATLSLSNSTIFFESGKKTAENNPVVRLKKSTAIFTGDKYLLRLRHLTLAATDSSSVIFKGKTGVGQLDLQLSRSSVEHREGDIGQLSIATDSVSHIAFQAKHLSKATITTTATQ